MLAVRCLGEFAIRLGDDWLAGSPIRKGRRLIQYLVAHPKRLVSRDELIEALWPECELDAAAHRLHIVVSAARTTLRAVLGGDGAIRSVRSSYALDDSVAVESDYVRFLTLAADDDIAGRRAALAMYRGEFLSGEDGGWFLPLRVRCASAFVGLLDDFAGAAFERRDYPNTLRYGLELIAAEQGHEGATRLVMRAFGALGRRERVRAVFDQLAAYLRKTLAVAPMPETTSLLRELMRAE
ncbi:MAG: winged helix-turn-helix domain-containing protein [Candidatus Eremiobacteraeota bacterium]|nr:winged helix-turn-helix domain-containing protein [Candidatus Eremiobacteraeota bacterium]